MQCIKSKENIYIVMGSSGSGCSDLGLEVDCDVNADCESDSDSAFGSDEDNL